MSLRIVLTESSLSRVWRQTTKYDHGIITAFRYAEGCGDGRVLNKKENLQRNAKLLAQLRKKYSVTSVKGTYIENYNSSTEREVKENSFVVIDYKETGSLKKDLIKLGRQYEQDSVLFNRVGEKATLIGTNKDCDNAYPDYKKEITLGKGVFGKSGEFHTKVNGRPFVFEQESIPFTYNEIKHTPSIRSNNQLSEANYPDINIAEQANTVIYFNNVKDKLLFLSESGIDTDSVVDISGTKVVLENELPELPGFLFRYIIQVKESTYN